MKTTFSTVDRLGEVLEHHRLRHAVLAGNVANVDTPGYVPKDLVEVKGAGGHGASGERLIDDPSVVGADGNGVSLERELAKVDANRVRYGACAELASRRLALLRYAASDGAA